MLRCRAFRLAALKDETLPAAHEKRFDQRARRAVSAKIDQPRYRSGKRGARLQSRAGRTEAEVNAETKTQVARSVAMNVEFIGLLKLTLWRRLVSSSIGSASIRPHGIERNARTTSSRVGIWLT